MWKNLKTKTNSWIEKQNVISTVIDIKFIIIVRNKPISKKLAFASEISVSTVPVSVLALSITYITKEKRKK